MRAVGGHVDDPTDDQLLAQWRTLHERGDTTAVEVFLADLDAADTAREQRLSAPGALGAAAAWYARQGLRVFPVQPRSKVPYPGSKGCHDATSDIDQVRTWWAARPDANIGLATGHLVDVFDVDGLDGIIALRWGADDQVRLPPLLGHATTPRGGGWHLYVPAAGQPNKAHVFASVDYRGAGGYVVAPPSVGGNGRRYRWLRPLDLSRLAQEGQHG